jgi:hypothetical protein
VSIDPFSQVVQVLGRDVERPAEAGVTEVSVKQVERGIGGPAIKVLQHDSRLFRLCLRVVVEAQTQQFRPRYGAETVIDTR